MSGDKCSASLSLDQPFQLFDDKEILSMIDTLGCEISKVSETVPDHLWRFLRTRRPDIFDPTALGAAVEGSNSESDSEFEG
jgi:hypothetical protein